MLIESGVVAKTLMGIATTAGVGGVGVVAHETYSGDGNSLAGNSVEQIAEWVDQGILECSVSPDVKSYLGNSATQIIQVELNEAGYSRSGPDNIFGKQTCKDLYAFQHDNNISIDGVVGYQTVGMFGTDFDILTYAGDGGDDVSQNSQTIEKTDLRNCLVGSYSVEQGNSWYSIAEKSNVNIEDLLGANNANSKSVIHPGEIICLPDTKDPLYGQDHPELSDAPVNQPVIDTAENNPVKSSNDCLYKAISKQETKRMLGDVAGLTDETICDAVWTFQQTFGLAQDGVVGPYTAEQLIRANANPCSFYGTSADDCVVGLQANGNLGKVLVVEDGDVIREMSARFGNSERTNGTKTPEGQFDVQRSSKGEYVSTNCIDDQGNGFVCMWNPIFFSGGIAIHGTEGPNNPNGSLGCMGVSNGDSEFIYTQYENGKVKKIVTIDFQRN